MGTAGQLSTCFRLGRQNPSVFPPDFTPWFIPLQCLKDLQGVLVSAQSHGYHVLHSQARGGESSFDIMTLQYKNGIGKANSSVIFILVSPLEQVMWALGSNYSQQTLARGGVKNFIPWLVAISSKSTPIYLLLTQEGFCGSSSETSSSLLQLQFRTTIPMAFLDCLLKCFTAFLFPRYKNYRIAPCQPSASTAARVNKPVRLCSHSSPLQLSLFKLLIHLRSPREF